MKSSRALTLCGIAWLVAAPSAFAGGDPLEVQGYSPSAAATLITSELPLLPADTNGDRDVYLRTPTGLTLLSNGALAGDTHAFALSADGTRAIFETEKALVPADTNTSSDVYAWQDGTLELISVGTTTGASAQAVDPTATRVLFETTDKLDAVNDQNTAGDVYLRAGSTTTMVSRRSGASTKSAYVDDATPDLHKVLFSTQQDIDAVQDTDGGHTDVYLRDLDAAVTPSLISGDADGAFDTAGGDISEDGAYVHFLTAEKLLVADADSAYDIYRRAVGGAMQLRSDDAVAGDANVNVTLNATSADGTRTLWSTTEAITSDLGADGDVGRDLFEATDAAPKRVSTGPAVTNVDSTGSFDAAPVPGGVIFDTSKSLVAGDNDTLTDVYLRSGSTTTLLSPGGTQSVQFLQAGTDGQHAIVGTIGALSPEDTDSEHDLYLVGADAQPKLLTPGTTGDTIAEWITPDLAHVLFITEQSLTGEDSDTDYDLYETTPSAAISLQSTVPQPPVVEDPPPVKAPVIVVDLVKPQVAQLAPKATLKAKVVRKGHVLQVTLSCPTACKGTLTLRSAKKLGKKTLDLGRASFTLKKKGTVTVKVSVPRRSRAKLTRALKGGVAATAVTTGTGMTPVTVKKTLKR